MKGDFVDDDLTDEERVENEKYRRMMADERSRSPRERITSEPYTTLEQAYFKVPGHKLIPIGYNRSEESVVIDGEKVRKLLKRSGKKQYTEIHTHPLAFFAPSTTDIKNFLKNDDVKTMVIADLGDEWYDEDEQEEAAGFTGYFVLRKTKKTPTYKGVGVEVKELARSLHKYRKAVKSESEKGIQDQIKKLAKEYHLNCKVIPGQPFQQFDPGWDFARSKGLESIFTPEPAWMALTILITFGLGIIFLSSNLTGNVIANLTIRTSSIIGTGLFIAGIIGSYFWFKKKVRGKVK